MDGSNDRQMYQGNWTCAGCGKDITELPFEPRSTENLMCRDCHAQSRANRPDRGERVMHEGNWTCSGCGKEVTQLPFQPRDGSTVQCRDCYIASKNG